jgi:hypothetical protein
MTSDCHSVLNRDMLSPVMERKGSSSSSFSMRRHHSVSLLEDLVESSTAVCVRENSI